MYIFLAIVSLISVIYLTILFLKKCPVNCFLRPPNSKRSHDFKEIPRIGGLIFISVNLMMIFFITPLPAYLSWYSKALSVIFCLGILDDIFSLNWKIKMFVQLIVGILLFNTLQATIHNIQLFTVILPLNTLFFPFFIIWFLGTMNAVNLIDGFDSLAAGVMCILCTGLAITGLFFKAPTFVWINILYISVLLGFLWHNKYPAKVFMGDCGSLCLGFHLAVSPFMLFFLNSTQILDFSPFIIMTTYLIWDTVRVMIVRITKNKSPFLPDRNHFHFILLDSTKKTI